MLAEKGENLGDKVTEKLKCGPDRHLGDSPLLDRLVARTVLFCPMALEPGIAAFKRHRGEAGRIVENSPIGPLEASLMGAIQDVINMHGTRLAVTLSFILDPQAVTKIPRHIAEKAS